MSYKITGAHFLNPNINVKEFNFDTTKDKVTQVSFKNQTEKKLIARVFKGKEQVTDGRFLVDDMDLVNPKFVKKRSRFIYTDSFVERFIPARMILVLSTLVDPVFIRNARINRLRSKYDYLNYTSSKNNMTSIKLKQNLDDIISRYISEEVKTQEKVSSEYELQINNFNNKKADEIFSNSENIAKIVAKSYQREKNKLNLLNLSLTFYQALWDDVYNFNDLRNSCTCEYNARHSSNKNVRKMKKELDYRQTRYVVQKQLHYINIRIMEARTLIRKQDKLVKQLKLQLSFEINKMYIREMYTKEAKQTLEKNIDLWNKVLADQLEEFTKNQQNYFFVTLNRRAQYVSKLLVVAIHQYHQLVLSGSLKYDDWADYKKRKKEYKSKIQSLYTQAYNFNVKQMDELGVTLDWFLKSTFKLSSLNILFVKILSAINSNKKNIFLMDLVHLLTDNDFKKLIQTINKIKKAHPEITFTIIDSKINKLPYLDKDIYSFVNEDFGSNVLTNLIDKEPDYYRSNVFNNKDVFKYIFTSNHLTTLGRKFIYQDIGIKENGSYFVNPMKMEYIGGEMEPARNTIYIPCSIKKAGSFNDPNMYYSRSENGDKFYFYSKAKVKLEKKSTAIVSFKLTGITEFI